MVKKSTIILYSASAFACFSYGIIAWKLSLWPSGTYRRAFDAYTADKERQDEIKQVMRDTASLEKRQIKNIATAAKTTLLDAEKSQPGLTLVVVGSDAAMLIDMSGMPRHYWHLPYSALWNGAPPHVETPNPDPMTRFIDARVLPNGDLLAIYHADNDTPYGYGLVKMDKDSKPIWSFPKNVHHNMYVAKDGSIFTLSQSYVDDYAQQIPHFKSPVLADAVTILTPDGQEKDTITIVDALLGTPYEQLLYTSLSKNDESKHDYTHANSVMPLEDDIAGKFPMFRAGQLLVSLRNLNAIAIIDLETRKVVWAMQGIWKQQHEARFMPNGHIMLFDNLGYTNGNESPRSRILEVDPVTGGVAWSYTGQNAEMFYSSFHGSQEILPGGNILTVETGEGNKLMEITRDKEIVWRYIVGPKNYRINPVNNAHRIPAGYFDEAFCNEVNCNDMNMPEQKKHGKEFEPEEKKRRKNSTPPKDGQKEQPEDEEDVSADSDAMPTERERAPSVQSATPAPPVKADPPRATRKEEEVEEEDQGEDENEDENATEPDDADDTR